MVSSTSVGAQRHGTLSTVLKAEGAVPQRVLTTAHPSQLLLLATLSLVIPKHVALVISDALQDKSSAEKPTPVTDAQRDGK